MASSENEPEQQSSHPGGDEEPVTPPPQHVDMQKFRLYETRSVISHSAEFSFFSILWIPYNVLVY